MCLLEAVKVEVGAEAGFVPLEGGMRAIAVREICHIKVLTPGSARLN